jgi:hypothetical protein
MHTIEPGVGREGLTEMANRVGNPPQGHQRASKVVVGFCVMRPQPNRFLQLREAVVIRPTCR